MTIRIRRYVEPLSLASQKTPAVIIESEAFLQICNDLEMYVNGEILGRSFLVAGHRGAGKTTMLRAAVQEVESRIRSLGKDKAPNVRPLFISLHGPDLLGGAPESKKEEKKPDAPAQPPNGGDDGEPVNPSADEPPAEPDQPATPAKPEKPEDGDGTAPLKPPPQDELRHFLDRITSGLYVGAAQEFALRFRERVLSANATAREKSELLELAADLQVQLDRQPDLDRLRDFWNRIGALDSGVLFERTTTDGHGVAEVTALFSIGRVMRTFAGKTTAQYDNEAKRTSEGSVSLVTIDGQNLLPPLIGLVSGVAVWSALPDNGDPLIKALSAVITGFGAVLALKVSATRTRSASQSWKETYIPEDDPGSLYRVLPGLIERFQRVGLFPIFVVDELDKVPGLGGKINALLGYMKQFVTERAFFCFVTNRSFYQQANAQAAGGAYSTLHTRFGDSVFVRYDATDFHAYLERIIDVDTTGLDPSAADKVAAAAVMLRYIVLGRAYLHPYDLRRELATWQDATGTLTRSVDDLLNSGRLQREAAAQVAVEVVFAGEALREHVRDPVRAQTALDALYYPIRKWREGAAELDLTQAKLTAHLRARTGIQEEVEAGAKDIPTEQLIPVPLQELLLAEVERMMALLGNPPALVDAARLAGVPLPEAVEQMLKTCEPLVEKVNA